MNSTFICEKCNSLSFEQMTYTQARCLECGYLNLYDSGFKGKRQFELSPEKDILNLDEKIVYATAPLIKRFVNYLVDIIFLSIIIVLFSIFTKIDITQVGSGTLQIYSIIGLMIYYIFMEFFFNKTLGKMFTKTKVISTDGKKLTFVQCILRSVFRIIPFEIISGFLMQGIFWHDSFAKTMVIEEN